MKSIIAYISIMLINCSLFALNFDTDEFYLKTDIAEGIYASKTELIMINEEPTKISIIDRVLRPKTLTNEFGYIELKLSKSKYYVINLNGLLFTPQNIPIKTDARKSNGINEGVTISASSWLREKQIEYKPENVLNRLTREKEIGEYLYWSALPWSNDSKVDKQPILNFRCTTAKKSLSILNGYIDFNKQNLYRDNSRIRKLQIIDTDTNKIIATKVIDDVLQYSKIQFDTPTKHFQIQILETYPGKKFTDICVSSIIFDEFFNTAPGDFGQDFIKELKVDKICK